jgi:polar amino acid transport system substrate-binding protein
MKRLLALATAASAVALTLSGCANYSSPAASSSSGSASAGGPALVAAGKLTVCTHLAYKPFQYKSDSNKIVGFDVDLMDLVAKKLGVTQEIVDIEFGQITSGAVFAAKKCDAGAAAITITDKRKEATSFSDPYFTATQALLVKSGSTVKDLPDLKGKTLGVQTDTTGQDYANKYKDQYGYTVKVFDDMPSGANAVLAGTVDAAINDNGVVYDYAKDNPTTTVVKEFNTGEHYGFNMGKDNTALQTTINSVIASAKSDGTYNTIYKKWFGVDAPK